jgi:hypothetical protein
VSEPESHATVTERKRLTVVTQYTVDGGNIALHHQRREPEFLQLLPLAVQLPGQRRLDAPILPSQQLFIKFGQCYPETHCVRRALTPSLTWAQLILTFQIRENHLQSITEQGAVNMYPPQIALNSLVASTNS